MKLRTTRKLNSVVLRIALYITALQLTKGGHIPDHRNFYFDRVANATLELLRVAFHLAASDKAQNRIVWAMVKAYLWTAWQRIIMLECYHIFRKSLLDGHSSNDSERENHAKLRGIELIPELMRLRPEELSQQLRTTPYLCSWSSRLLFSTPTSLTTDFRSFFQAYSRLHGMKAARCNGQEQCDGNSSANCGRFISAGVINQSAHDTSCLGNCRKLTWNENNFRTIQGARAVCLRENGEHLQYISASEHTMAISHVWSHGQGGRPEPHTPQTPDGTGFNLCLHQRYARLAYKFGCSSYWMDTPCIPSETLLRNECIQYINEIFTRSKVTLICDRDIADIDISDICTDLLESLLTTLLVCDWNLRAWTLLEGMRGREKLLLLCKDNKTISVAEVLRLIQQSGQISLSVIALNSGHLFPTYRVETSDRFYENLTSSDTESEPEITLEYLQIGEAAALLSHRHMTRNQDDVIIWGYLIGNIFLRDGVQLW